MEDGTQLVGIITESDFVRAMAGSAGGRVTDTILVVDDERDLLVTCERLLNRRGLAGGDRRQPRGGADRPEPARRGRGWPSSIASWPTATASTSSARRWPSVRR